MLPNYGLSSSALWEHLLSPNKSPWSSVRCLGRNHPTVTQVWTLSFLPSAAPLPEKSLWLFCSVIFCLSAKRTSNQVQWGLCLVWNPRLKIDCVIAIQREFFSVPPQPCSLKIALGWRFPAWYFFLEIWQDPKEMINLTVLAWEGKPEFYFRFPWKLIESPFNSSKVFHGSNL